MKLKVYLIFGLIIAMLAVSFALQNSQQVTIGFFKWSTEINVSFLVLVSIFIGLLLNWLLSIPAVVQNFMEKTGLRSRVKKLEKNLAKTEKEKAAELKERTKLETEKKELDAGITKIKAN